MKTILFGIAVVVCAACGVIALLWWWKRGKGRDRRRSRIFTSIEDLRSVGELVVFKILTKEIVTAADHWFGEWGKRYFTWLASTKKMAMIFEFEIDFRYDLRSGDFIIERQDSRSYRLKMPKCFYKIYIRDISFYDEQNAKLLPWLLPDLLNRAFGSGFDETDKNHLMEEAKQQADEMARDFVEKMHSEVQSSARQTLEALARSFGAEETVVDFTDSKLVPVMTESRA